MKADGIPDSLYTLSIHSVRGITKNSSTTVAKKDQTSLSFIDDAWR